MKNFKPLNKYEKELRASIKRIQKLNRTILDWDEYYKSKFGERYDNGYGHYDN